MKAVSAQSVECEGLNKHEENSVCDSEVWIGGQWRSGAALQAVG